MNPYILRSIIKTLIEYAVVISIGLGIVYLDESEFAAFDIKYLIVILAAFKAVYFLAKGLGKISEFSGQNIEYYEFLVFIAVNISIIILSFGVDYLCLYRVDTKSFSGIPEGMTGFALAFKFFYFSLMIFANIGIIKIIPESTESEILVIFEAILSFITIIFVLSDFLSLKESLSKRLASKDSVS